MKAKVPLLVITNLLICLCTELFAVTNYSGNTRLSVAIQQEYAEKPSKKINKKFLKLQKRKRDKTEIRKGTRKWLWVWLGGWLLGIAIYALAMFFAFKSVTAVSSLFLYIGMGVFMVGTIGLVVWLIKKLS